MSPFNSYKFPTVRSTTLFIGLFTSLFLCQNLWAYQSAMVIAERAVIYADEQMSAPLGFIRKGKKIKVGEIARNHAQVYPIIVSGKMAYVRVIDLSTETESVSGNLVAERFQKVTKEERTTNYAVSFFNFASQVSLEKENVDLKNKDALNWLGFGIRGGVKVSPSWDMDLIGNYLNSKSGKEGFNVLEFGIGGSARIYEESRFKVRYYLQLLAVPFATYALGDDFRINGYGYSMGTGLNLAYRLGKNVGIEGYGGFYYMKLSGFDAPAPYNSIDPSFMGTRLGLGFNYEF